MNARRVRVLVGKELREFRANPGALAPLLVVLGVTIWLPLVMLVLIPRVTGHTLAAERDIREIVERTLLLQPALASLPIEAAAEAFMLQHLLAIFLLGPIIGAVSLAAYSVVGEKQGKSLEPLLTTPLTTAELLVAKVFASLLPALSVEIAGVAIYLVLVAALAEPGVVGVILSTRTVVLLALVGPLAALTALQMAIAVSSRVNDPRSAQQIAVIVVVPIVALVVGQISGAFILQTWHLFVMAFGLGVLWVAMAWLSVKLFDRETILTRWK